METIRDFLPSDRYSYDFGECSIENGFAQIDTSQDASYFGTWANPEKLLVVTYCEGDVIIRKAATDAEFVEEIRQIKQWNEDSGHSFLGIDPGLGETLISKFKSIGLGDLLH